MTKKQGMNHFFLENFSTADEIKHYFFTRNQPYLGDNLSSILSLVNNNPHYKEEIEQLKEKGEKLLSQTMTYDNEWDMERCLTPYQLGTVIHWEETPNGDPEWMWMLNRQRYMIQLVQLYCLTKEKQYLYCFFDWLDQWITYHKSSLVSYAKTSCRTIDTGIRLKNWCICLNMIFQQQDALALFPDELLMKLMKSLHDQVSYLMRPENLTVAPVSNWKILEMNGVIATLTLFPELDVPEDWFEKSINYTNQAVNLQIREDGCHWEQSFMYHHEVFLSLLEIWALGSRLNFTNRLTFKTQLEKMLTVSLALTKPDGTQSPFGDSDEEQMASLLTKAALVLNHPQAKFLGESRLSFDTLCFYGGLAEEVYKQIPSIAPPFKKIILPDSGLVFLRDCWDKAGIYTMFASGPQGGGHGHCDLLHVEIHAGEDYLLSDSGRFTYLEEGTQRKEFKKSLAHNVPTVDNKEFTSQRGSWTFNTVGHSLPTFCRLTESVDYIEASHLGYMTDEDNVFTQRKLIYIQTGIWLLVDYFHTNETHLYQQHFHFPGTRLTQLEKNEVVYKGNQHQLFIQTLQKENTQLQIEETFYSPQYNKRVPSKKLVHESSHQVMVTVLSLDRSIQLKERSLLDLEQKEIDSAYASCYELTDAHTTHQVILTHLEDQTAASRKVYQIDGHSFVARAAYHQHQTGSICLKG